MEFGVCQKGGVDNDTLLRYCLRSNEPLFYSGAATQCIPSVSIEMFTKKGGVVDILLSLTKP